MRKLVFDKKLFKKNAPKNVQKILSSHVDDIDGGEVIFQDCSTSGTVEYQHEGQDFYLYPVEECWCREVD